LPRSLPLTRYTRRQTPGAHLHRTQPHQPSPPLSFSKHTPHREMMRAQRAHGHQANVTHPHSWQLELLGRHVPAQAFRNHLEKSSWLGRKQRGLAPTQSRSRHIHMDSRFALAPIRFDHKLVFEIVESVLEMRRVQAHTATSLKAGLERCNLRLSCKGGRGHLAQQRRGRIIQNRI